VGVGVALELWLPVELGWRDGGNVHPASATASAKLTVAARRRDAVLMARL
jgi:hypothetical protein